MEIKKIEDYAHRLYAQSGPRAIALAAQKAAAFESAGETGEAETWRKIEASLISKRGAPQG